MSKPLNNKSLIFTTKNDELAIFGQTIDDVRNKLINFNDVIMQGGTIASNKKQIIPASKLIQELTSVEGKEIVNILNSIKSGTNSAFSSMDDYLTWLGGKGKTYISDYVKENQNQIYTTEGVIASSKAARDAQIAHNLTIKQSTIAYKAATLAKKMFSMVGNMAAMWALSKVIEGVVKTVDELAHTSDNVAKKAQEVGDSFSNTKKDIENYKTQVEDLQETIHDSSSSISEVSEARKNLLSIQDELINKYGTEEDAIHSITSAINGETEAWEKLTEVQWQKAKNEFNDNDFWEDLGNSIDGYRDNISRMLDEYGNYSQEINVGSILGTEKRKEAEKLLSQFGEISKSDADIASITLTGNASEVHEQLLNIQNVINEMDFDFGKSFEAELTKMANATKKVSDQYTDMYNQYILNEEVFKNGEYRDSFKDITEQYQKLQDAISSNNSEKVNTETDNFAQTVVNSMNQAFANGDKDVADYFRKMYPELQGVIDQWQFDVDFEANTEQLKTNVSDALSKLNGRTTETLIDFNYKAATDDEIEGYNELCRLADMYNMEIEEFIRLLEKRDLVASESYNQLVGKFGKDNVITLSDEDLQIAYEVSDGTIQSWDELLAKIEDCKTQVETVETPSLTFNDDQVKSINDYKSALKTLQTSLEDIDNVDVTDLMTQFNDYDWSAYQDGAKTLEEVIYELADRAFKHLGTTLGDTAEMFRYLYDAEFNAEAKLAKLEEQIQKNNADFERLQAVLEKVRNGQSLSADETATLISRYNELSDKILVTTDGYSIEEDALVSLVNTNKKANNEIVASEIETTKKIIEETKTRIEAIRITLAAYNQVANAFNGGYGDNESAEGTRQLADAESRLSELVGKLSTLEGMFSKTEASTKKSSSSTSEFSQSIDWLSQSVTALEEHVQGLDDALNNAKGYEAQISAINNLVAGQKELQDAYKTTSQTYDKLYKDKLGELQSLGLSDKEVSQITARIEGLSSDELDSLYQSNSISSLFENFIGKGDNSMAEQMYNLITEAMDYSEKKLQAEKNLISIGVKIDNSSLQALELSRDNNQAKVNITEEQLGNDELTDIERRNYLKEIESQTKALYADEIEIAKAKKDITSKTKLEIELSKKLLDIEEQRIEILNNATERQISEYERIIQDAQNAIDETGRATVEQYQAQIAANEAIRKLREQQVISAQADIDSMLSRGIDSGIAYDEAITNLGDCKDRLSECIQQTKEWKSAILQLNIQSVEKHLDSLNDKIGNISSEVDKTNKTLDKYNGYISAAQYAIQQQIDAQNALKKPLQEQLEALQDSNEERQQALNLQQALWELERARNQKNIKVYREGQGWVYEADQAAIREKQQKYDDALYNNKIYQLQKQIQAIDDYISTLSDMQNAWGEITKEIENAANLMKALNHFGSDFTSKVMSGDQSFMQQIAQTVESITRQKEALESSLEATEQTKTSFEDMIKQLQAMATAYAESNMTFEEASQSMRNVVERIYPEIAGQLRDAGLDGLVEDILQELGIVKVATEITAGNTDEKTKDMVDTTVSAKENIENELINASVAIKTIGDDIGSELTSILNTVARACENLTSTIAVALDEQTDMVSISTNDMSNSFISMSDSSQSAMLGLVGTMQSVGSQAASVASQIREAINLVNEFQSNDYGSMTAGNSGSGSGSGSGKYSSGKNFSQITFHDGIRNGFVGEKVSSKEKEQIKLLATTELKPFEVPGILEKGEAVFNEEQQSMLLKNLHSAIDRSNLIPKQPDFNSFARTQQSPSVNVAFGENSVVLNEVNSGEALLKEMTAKIKPVFMQTFSSIQPY